MAAADRARDRRRAMSLSADMGESFGRWPMGSDEALLAVVTSASVACGFHAGDPMVMAYTVQAAAAQGVGVGAHPGYRDLEGFGRRDMRLTFEEIRTLVLYQVAALDGFCRAAGTTLEHVKPHGQLYNRALVDEEVARAVVSGIRQFDPALPVVALGGALATAAQEQGLPVAVEAYLDRAYADDGTLVPRSQPGALLTNTQEVVERARRLVEDGQLRAASGRTLAVAPDTLIIHGDTPGAADLAKAVRSALEDAGVEWLPMGAVVERRSA